MSKDENAGAEKAKQSREERLAEQLRANLRRRKDQSRALKKDANAD